MHATRTAFASLALSVLAFSPAPAFVEVTVEVSGTPSIVFDSSRDACTPDDVPDLNARAFRDASGQVVMFALHNVNRALRGPDFAHLKIDCHVALGSPFDPEPSHYADHNFITATWTTDGRTVAALVHEEYHADQHKRCRVDDALGCWYNTVLNYRSTNGGTDFSKAKPLVVAAAPFRQDVEQGRHRGFFNPSNVVASGRFFYALISTTGWTGQGDGNCLFRTKDPLNSAGWRAYDGTKFSIRYEDPYVARAPHPASCAIIGSFVFPVGALVRHAASKMWIAVFQASPGGEFPVNGFYYATSPDLFVWSAPKILVVGQTLYTDLCKAGPSVINYPSVLDATAKSRNFDEVGDHPDLFFASIQVGNCATGQRLLVREQLTIRQGEKS